jgi:hypothetical protein
MKIADLTQTCSACPSQWEFTTDGDRNAYVRYRWGYLSVRISKEPGGDAVRGIEILGRQIGDEWDGVLDWSVVEKLIKPIHIKNTLRSMQNNKP